MLSELILHEIEMVSGDVTDTRLAQLWWEVAAKYVEALLYGFCCGCISQPHHEYEEANQELMFTH